MSGWSALPLQTPTSAGAGRKPRTWAHMASEVSQRRGHLCCNPLAGGRCSLRGKSRAQFHGSKGLRAREQFAFDLDRFVQLQRACNCARTVAMDIKDRSQVPVAPGTPIRRRRCRRRCRLLPAAACRRLSATSTGQTTCSQQGAAPPPPSQHQRPPADPALDFYSRAFDAAAALAAPGLRPPVPGARPLDSIFRCRFMLPDGHPDAWREPAKAPKSKVRWRLGGGPCAAGPLLPRMRHLWRRPKHPPRRCPQRDPSLIICPAGGAGGGGAREAAAVVPAAEAGAAAVSAQCAAGRAR